MTTLLEQAFAEAAKLPLNDQDDFARWILAELADQQRWRLLLKQTADRMEWLADQAANDPQPE